MGGLVHWVKLQLLAIRESLITERLLVCVPHGMMHEPLLLCNHCDFPSVLGIIFTECNSVYSCVCHVHLKKLWRCRNCTRFCVRDLRTIIGLRLCFQWDLLLSFCLKRSGVYLLFCSHEYFKGFSVENRFVSPENIISQQPLIVRCSRSSELELTP